MSQAAPTVEAPPRPQDAGALPTAPLVGRVPAAWATSLVMHGAAIAALAVVTLSMPSRTRVELELAPLDVVQEEQLPREFASSDQPTDHIGALSAAGVDAAMAAAPELALEPVASVVADDAMLSDFAERPVVELDIEMLAGPELSEDVPTQGSGSVGVTGAEGAIDRLTHEIIASLEQRPTLVAWLFDESGSLRDERTRIRARLERVYRELGVIAAADDPAFERPKDKPLLSAVVKFGAVPELVTRQPTDKFEEIAAAIKAISNAPEPRRNSAGKFDDEVYRQLAQENVFTAVRTAAEKFRTYQSAKNGKRRVMIIVFTDEAGDDVAAVDETVDLCRKLAIPVYVVGRPAPFGRETAYVKWIDPDPRFDQRPQFAPVRLGPESLLPEVLKLRSAEGGDEEELLDSGFGPYGLTRLCYETGGLYFATHPNRAVGRHVSRDETNLLAPHFAAFFDPDAMRRYQPRYVSARQYMTEVQASAARSALIQAAQMSWTSPMENVRLRFPKRSDAELVQALTQAQRTAALVQPKINAICQTLLAGENERASESEARWQAGYDLALGRALAFKARTDGYNVMLAKAKQGMAFEKEGSNTWVLRPGKEFGDSSLEKVAEKAEDYLRQVVREHPDTPWSMFAARELEMPLGWRWVEDYTRLPSENNNENPPRPRPEPPPGPPRRDPPPL